MSAGKHRSTRGGARTQLVLGGVLLLGALSSGCTYRTATVVTGSNTIGGTLEPSPCGSATPAKEAHKP